MPFFSIIIPVYKVEAYLRECLDSVLAQTFSDWEGICVDDGSPDNCGAILDEYAARDSRFRVIHQENGGLSAARNSALNVANGEWLYYLDSDDLMPPELFSKVFEDLKGNTDADLLWGHLMTFADGSQPEWNDGEEPPAKVIDISDTLFFRHFSTYFQTFIFKRSVFGDIPFVGASWCEERPYHAKCMAKAKKLIEVGYFTYGFRAREGSITHTRMRIEHCNGYLDATRDVIRILSASGKKIEPSLMRLLLTNWMEWSPRYILELVDAKDRPSAWRYWFQSIKELSEYDFAVTTWRKFTIAACRAFPAWPTAWLLCYLPDYIKRKGLHR